MILYILQNSYQSDKYKFKNHEEWHDCLQVSHTGRRLREMIPDNVEFRVINASPNIGNKSDAKYPADAAHIKKYVDKYKPSLIVACGKVANDGVFALYGKSPTIPIIRVAHPAYRALPKTETSMIKSAIEEFYKMTQKGV